MMVINQITIKFINNKFIIKTFLNTKKKNLKKM